jgi:Cys-tRNA(Pro)/Cys-tRNA(Cys) deacylase
LRASVDVHTQLLDRDIPHEIYATSGPIRFLEDAADALGLSPSEVIRVTVFSTPAGPVATLTPLGVEPDAGAVAAAAGTAVARRETPAGASRHTGYIAHWVPPVAHEREVRVLIDRSVLAAEIVYTAGGEPGVILKIRPDDLVRATAGILADVAQPSLVER